MTTLNHAENMTAILRRIGGALIQATPESWSEATLRVEVTRAANGASIKHSIHSQQHQRDVVVATDEIFAATRELQLLCDQAGEPLSAFQMEVRQEGEDWKFKVDFEYST